MGVAQYTILRLIEKVVSWLGGGSGGGGGFLDGDVGPFMSLGDCGTVCWQCQECLDSPGHWCRSCGRLFCQKCMHNGSSGGWAQPGLVQEDEEPLVLCKFCFRAMSSSPEVARPLRDVKVSSLPSSENGLKSPLSLSRYSTDKFDPLGERRQFSLPSSLSCSTYRNFEEDEGYESSRQLLTPTSELSQDYDTMSVYTSNELSSFKSSPAHSPLQISEKGFCYVPCSPKNNSFHHGSTPQLQRSRVGAEYRAEHSNEVMPEDVVAYPDRESPKVEQPLDIGKNGLIWYPPPPEEEVDDEEISFFRIDDEYDEIDDSGNLFTPGNFSGDLSREKHNEAQKESLKSAVCGHFRALVSQLLKGEDITVSNGDEDWLEVVSLLAWQAANFVRPDTSNGGSMDPGKYVKVKCITSGKPSDSSLVKGVVCTKNIKHKRMISQHKHPRVLIMGGALDFQKSPNELASIDALLGQETDHLKTALAKIENLRPNVLLVEKSVSSYAQDRILAKNEISLVLNVKRSLLERISRCTGAEIIPTIDSISSARLGHCESFRTEKFDEECSSFNELKKKKSSKTLMFLEGCPKRLGCTVLLRGASREELKKVKRVIQYASFAAYHLSLETSFLADEGATVPKHPVEPPVSLTKKLLNVNGVSMCSSSVVCDHGSTGNNPKGDRSCGNFVTESISLSSDVKHVEEELMDYKEQGHRYWVGHVNSSDLIGYPSAYSDHNYINHRHSNDSVFAVNGEGSECPSPLTTDIFDPEDVNLDYWMSDKLVGSTSEHKIKDAYDMSDKLVGSTSEHKRKDAYDMSDKFVGSTSEHKRKDAYDMSEVPREYLSAADNHQSILVSFSSTCLPKGNVCERPQLFRIKFYGSFDKPLGQYLRNDLFNQKFHCESCKEPTESHVRCYTHQQGSLSISVNRLSSMKLPGERDGKIWMWHRCLKCEMKDGVPPAARRVIMSDAAWGLSFGKFLELSFSDHATANRIANCGHSLQKDCLRFYGFGNMVAFFRHSPVDILSVQLPPTALDFTCQFRNEWMKNEVDLIYCKMDLLCAEITKLLQSFESKARSFDDKSIKVSAESQIMGLKDMLKFERNEYEVRLQNIVGKNIQTTDVLELNRLRRELLLYTYLWDDRLHSLNSLYNAKFSTKVVVRLSQTLNNSVFKESREELHSQVIKFGDEPEETSQQSGLLHEFTLQVLECNSNIMADMDLSVEHNQGDAFAEDLNFFSQKNCSSDEQQIRAKLSPLEDSSWTISNIPDKIDSAWSGSGQLVMNQPKSYHETLSPRSSNAMDDSYYKKIGSPVRFYSFDSASQLRKRLHGGLFLPDSSGTLTSMVKNPAPGIRRAYSQGSRRAAYRSNMQLNYLPLNFSSSFYMFGEGVRLFLPQTGLHDIVVAVYDDEPTSIISYALTSQEYNEFILTNLVKPEDSNVNTGYQLGYWSADFTNESQTKLRRLSDPKDPHFRMSFDDDCSCPTGKAKFSVTCYFAKQFDALRKKCCPNEMDYVRSLSRCKKWNAQGGKSNVYFAKSLDDRFIIKQVTKTELDSFEIFAPKYFNYLTDAVASGSPTCLAKILGIYQVTIKHLKGGREVKMDLLVMENIFHNRNISRVYDLKGSLRSRYNPDTSGINKVLLDLNLLETIVTKPIFLGSYAKRRLERAVWNDTSFLASIGIMDYSLLVGVDEEENELVIGIIDFMRQYTWDKQLESWVKASGILGGPKNASPTVISPDQYKKRFRKAMSNYFLTVPDQWPT